MWRYWIALIGGVAIYCILAGIFYYYAFDSFDFGLSVSFFVAAVWGGVWMRLGFVRDQARASHKDHINN
mgnify:CR=1 FL=1